MAAAPAPLKLDPPARPAGQRDQDDFTRMRHRRLYTSSKYGHHKKSGLKYEQITAQGL